VTTPERSRALLDSPEGSRIEFKAALGGFAFDDLVKYCVALANEGGGRIVLGVTDQRPPPRARHEDLLRAGTH
jgi:ATP-dependent DNA helicase RecG